MRNITKSLILSAFLCASSSSLAQNKALTAAEIAQSIPNSYEPSTCDIEGATLTVTPLTFAEPILCRKLGDGIQGLCLDGKNMSVLIGGVGMVSFTLPAPGATELVVDKTFGEGGTMKVSDRNMEGVSTDGKGRYYLNGNWNAKIYDAGKDAEDIRNGTAHFRTSAGQGFVVGDGAIFPIIGGKVSEKSLPVPGLDRGATAGWAGPAIAVAMKTEGDKGGHIRVFGRGGKAPISIGNTTDVFKPDGFCYINAVAGTDKVIAVVDGNCRKIGFWNHEGTFLGSVETDEFNLSYPWLTGLTFDEAKGHAYLCGHQDRAMREKDLEAIRECFIFRIEGFDKLP